MLGPAINLASVGIALGAVIVQPRGLEIDGMDRGQNAVHLVLHGAPVRNGQFGQARIVEMAAIHLVHHIKGGTDDAVIFAQHMHPRHRHIRPCQCLLHAELPLDRMGGFQQDSRRFAPQHIARRGRDQAEGRVALPTREFLRLDRTLKPRQVIRQPAGDGLGIQLCGGMG